MFLITGPRWAQELSDESTSTSVIWILTHQISRICWTEDPNPPQLSPRAKILLRRQSVQRGCRGRCWMLQRVFRASSKKVWISFLEPAVHCCWPALSADVRSDPEQPVHTTHQLILNWIIAYGERMLLCFNFRHFPQKNSWTYKDLMECIWQHLAGLYNIIQLIKNIGKKNVCASPSLRILCHLDQNIYCNIFITKCSAVSIEPEEVDRIFTILGFIGSTMYDAHLGLPLDPPSSDSIFPFCHFSKADTNLSLVIFATWQVFTPTLLPFW